MQKEVGELLAKGAIELLAGGDGVYSMYLLFISALMVCSPNLILCDLITLCKYLLLRYLPSDRYGNLFSKVMMFFLLISRMFVYIFLLLSIIFNFYILLANRNLISGYSCQLGWHPHLGFSHHSLNPYCSFADTWGSVLLFIWMISWS